MKEKFPEEFKICPNYVRHKSIHVDPRIVREAGIKVCRVVQRPGDHVVTFPGAYHTGYNSGFNVAEAANFGCGLWIKHFAREIENCICDLKEHYSGIIDAELFIRFVVYTI